jgi:hypothetical protein
MRAECRGVAQRYDEEPPPCTAGGAEAADGEGAGARGDADEDADDDDDDDERECPSRKGAGARCDAETACDGTCRTA